MSHDPPQSSDSEWDEWEVVHFQTESTTSETKAKKAKEKDVEKLAKEIREQLTTSQQEEKTKLEELNRKLNEQRQISESKLQQIALQLQSIVTYQQMTHNNHQETNAKLQQANEKLRQIEIEKEKQRQQRQQNQQAMANLSFPTLQQPLPSMIQPTILPNESFPYCANNNGNMFNNINNNHNVENKNNANSNNFNNSNNSNNPNNPNNSSNSNNTNNSNRSNNNTNNNRPSTLTSVFNFLLGTTNSDESDDDDDDEDNATNEEKHNTVEEDWECNNCHSKNDEASKYCPTCGTQNPILTNPTNINKNDNVENKNLKDIGKNAINFKLKCKGHVGEGKYDPNESRQCGWILTNNTKSPLKMKGYLKKIGGEDIVKVKTEKCYEIDISTNDEIYLLCDVVAPMVIGKYCLYYQFVSSHDGSLVSDILELIVEVKSQFPKDKEEKIENIVKMGFNDRNKIVFALQTYNWNIQQAVEHLLPN